MKQNCIARWRLGALIVVSMLLRSPELAGGEPRSAADTSALVRANTGFAADLYGTLRDREGNLFLSPYSISTALAMTYAGARGDTAQAMARVVHFAELRGDVHPGFAALEARMAEIQKEGQVQLNVANSLWPQRGYALLSDYLDLTCKYYQAAITPVDFAQSAAAAQTINRWVEERTQQKIKDLLQPGAVDARTRLVLVNAIYFKGSWLDRFDAELTADAPFHLGPGRSVPVPMMHRKGDYGFRDYGRLKLLELPYTGQALSLMVVLPGETNGLPQLEAELTPTLLESWAGSLPQREVHVYLPRFRMTAEFELQRQLAKLGMGVAFQGGAADFSGLNGRRDLELSAVIHKAFVDVNEEGTEAAAATAVGVRLTAMPAPPPVFRADHPFLFLIRDHQTRSILFLGRVTNPKT